MAVTKGDLKATIAEQQKTIEAQATTISQQKATIDSLKKQLADCQNQTPTPPPLPPASVQKGIATPGDLQNWSSTDRARYLDAYKAAGANWIRVGLNWGYPGPGVTLAKEAQARGLKVLGCLMRYGGILDPYQMADFAGQMALNADAFEIWNEPNISNFWPTPDPVKYAGVYNAGKNAIKAKRPEVTVVSGGLSPAPNSTSTIDPADFLTRALTAGMKPEAIGWHPYCNPNLPGQNATWSTWTKMTSHATWGKYPIWLTEFGAPTNDVTEAFQAQSVTEAFRLWKSYGLTTPIFIYEGRDGGTDPANSQHHYGMLRYDWSQKPSYTAFKNIT